LHQININSYFCIHETQNEFHVVIITQYMAKRKLEDPLSMDDGQSVQLAPPTTLPIQKLQSIKLHPDGNDTKYYYDGTCVVSDISGRVLLITAYVPLLQPVVKMLYQTRDCPSAKHNMHDRIRVNPATPHTGLLFALLPSELCELIVDYMPLYMYPVCEVVAQFARFLRRDATHSRHSYMCDAIKRNDMAHFRHALEVFETTRMLYVDVHPSGNVITEDFERQLHVCWIEAARYGRLEMIDMLNKIYDKSHSGDYYMYTISRLYAEALRKAPNRATVDMLLNTRYLARETNYMYHNIVDAIENGLYKVLEWAYDNLRSDGVSYLAAFINNYPTDQVFRYIKVYPVMAKWFLDKQWQPATRSILEQQMAKY
jgi:hypothetical protein